LGYSITFVSTTGNSILTSGVSPPLVELEPLFKRYSIISLTDIHSNSITV